MTDPLRAPTVQDLIDAFAEAIDDESAATQLTTEPASFAKERGWTFTDEGDYRISKFLSVQPEGFEAAKEVLKLTAASDREAAKTFLAKTLCASTRIVKWSQVKPEDTAAKC